MKDGGQVPVCTRKWPYLNHFSDLFAQTEPVAYLQDHQGFQIDFHEIEGKNQEPVYIIQQDTFIQIIFLACSFKSDQYCMCKTN